VTHPKNLQAQKILAEIGVPETFCPLPWIHLMGKFTGEIRPCCYWEPKYSEETDFPMKIPGDLDIGTVINSEQFRNLRKQFLAGEKRKNCRACWRLEEMGQTSLRTNRIMSTGKQRLAALVNDTKDGHLDNFKLLYTDMRLSNICNFKCRMCGPHNSNRIAQEYDELGWKYHIPRTEDTDQWFDEFVNHIDNVEILYFAGGEPLMMEQHWRMLDRLIELEKFNIRINYNTNLSVMNFKGRDIFDLWNRFETVYVGMSIDHVGTRAEYQRYGASWSTIVKNFYDLQTRSPHVWFAPACTVTVLNILDLPHILQTLEELGFVTDIHGLTFNIAEWPDYLSVQSLPLRAKAAAESRLREMCAGRGNSVIDRTIVDGLKGIINYMRQQDTFDQQYFEFLNSMHQQDRVRSQSLQRDLPELYHFYAEELADRNISPSEILLKPKQ
jgi:MoaA/NifB/PqqE/SkfB family radical SAM enzyme